ncbi:MAG: hypothetical protein PHI02_01330 [Sulfurovaceae bacterium]|nr:hypothetical protein [Sulfurovaceae bacterium]
MVTLDRTPTEQAPYGYASRYDTLVLALSLRKLRHSPQESI